VYCERRYFRMVTREGKNVRLMIVEDNHFVREGWLAVLRSARDIDVLGAFGSCEEAFEADSLDSADVVLMDIGLPGMSGIEGARQIRERRPDCATVMCTVYEDDEKILDALCAGAVGYLLKKTPAVQLIKAIHDAAGGGSPMEPSIARKIIDRFHRPVEKASPQNQLTNGERDVLVLLAHGKSYAKIAEELFLSLDGVRQRIRRIYEKLQAHTRGEAVAKGLSRRIISPPGAN